MSKGWRTMTASEAVELASVAEKTAAITPQTVIAAKTYTAQQVIDYVIKTQGHENFDWAPIRKHPRWELQTIPLDEIPACDESMMVSQPFLAAEYAKLTTPFPPIVLDENENIFDGTHRCWAALERGDEDIRAFVPVKNSKKATSQDDDETTPLKVADPPDIIETFRYMRPFERDRLIEEAPLKEVSPYELKTSQSAVSRHKVQWFMDNPEEIATPRTDIALSDTEQPYPLVLETNDGLWLYDGNHRSAAAYKLDLMIEAKVVDLRDLEDWRQADARLIEEDKRASSGKVAKQYGHAKNPLLRRATTIQSKATER